MFHKSLGEGQAGDQVGALLRGVKREEIRRGMVLCAPGTVTPRSKFKAQVYVLKKEEGGRHTPFVTNYKPQLFTRTADVSASMKLPEGEILILSSFIVTQHVGLPMMSKMTRLTFDLIGYCMWNS